MKYHFMFGLYFLSKRATYFKRVIKLRHPSLGCDLLVSYIIFIVPNIDIKTVTVVYTSCLRL